MFTVTGKQMQLGMQVNDRRYSFAVGLDGVYRISSQSPSTLPTGVRAAWQRDGTLRLEYDEIGRVNHFTFSIRFIDESIRIGVTEPTGLYQLTLKGVGM